MYEVLIVAIILLFLSVIIHQVEGTSIKKYNTKYSNGGFIFIAIVSLFSMLFFAITDKNGLDFSLKIIPYAVAAGFFYSSASVLTFMAYGCGSFVITNLILSYGLIFTIGFGVFILKEEISVFTYIGFIIMMVSLYLSRGTQKEDGIKISAKWLVCIVLAAFGSGMFAITQKIQQLAFDNLCTNEFMVIALGFSAITLFIIGLKKDGKNLKHILKNGFPYASLAGVSNGLTNALSLYVYTLIPISIVTPTSAGIKIIVSFIISKLIFKENFVKRQIASVILGTAAVIFLNL